MNTTEPLRWTREAPKEPGWYWRRLPGFGINQEVVEVYEDSVNVEDHVGTVRYPLRYRSRHKQPDCDRAVVEWSGPIPPPSEG